MLPCHFKKMCEDSHTSVHCGDARLQEAAEPSRFGMALEAEIPRAYGVDSSSPLQLDLPTMHKEFADGAFPLGRVFVSRFVI